MNNEKGFSLITVLILSAVVFVLGSAAVYVSQYGYILVSSDVKYKTAEKRADYGIMKVFNDMNNQQLNCGDSKNYADGVVVYTVKAGSSCFIKSVGTFAGATVSKIAVISTQSTSTKYATVVMCNLSNMNLDGSSSIESCESSCITPALITRNDYTNRLNNINTQCNNNNKGLTALMDPYKHNPDICNQELLSLYFNNINNRSDLFNKMTSLYGVAFDNGKPIGIDTTGKTFVNITDRLNPADINGNSYDVCNFTQNANLDTVSAVNSTTLSASSSYNISGVNKQVRPTFTWDSVNNRYIVYLNSTDGSIQSIVFCKSVDLGQNATLELKNSFIGGGALAANEVNFKGDVNTSNLTVVARNNIKMETNNVNISNVNMFGQNYSIDANKLIVQSSLIFGGGGGQNINIKLNSNSKLGTSDNPVLIISDNNINISRNGDAEINGLVFATTNNNNFNISGNGNFSINGMLISNGQNNNINIGGNFKISFDSNVISNLYNKFNNLVKPAECSSKPNYMQSLILTKQIVF